jgi:hypothetical protein
MKNGYGIKVSIDKQKIYKGNWKNDEKHGEGKL